MSLCINHRRLELWIFGRIIPVAASFLRSDVGCPREAVSSKTRASSARAALFDSFKVAFLCSFESTNAAYVTSAKAERLLRRSRLRLRRSSMEESAPPAFGAPVCWYRELRSVGLSDQIREVSPR